MQDNPTYRQNWILDNLKVNPTYNYAVMFSKYVVEFRKSEQTFVKDWKKANAIFSEYQILKNKAKLEQSIDSEKEAVKSGLKTKNDRLFILQNLVEECLEQLSNKECNDIIVFDGKVKNITRFMNQRELNDTRKTLNILQIEISKIEGDYAAKKTELSGKVEIDQSPKLDLSKLSDETLQELLKTFEE